MSHSEAAVEIATSTEGLVQTVDGSYLAILGRAPDASGMTSAFQFLATGHSWSQLQAILIGSTEFFQAHAGGTDAGFVTALYQVGLGRAPDAEGEAASNAFLDQGNTRLQLADVVLGSVEAATDAIQTTYQTFLRHPANAAAFAAAVASQPQDETQVLDAAITGVFDSPEILSDL